MEEYPQPVTYRWNDYIYIDDIGLGTKTFNVNFNTAYQRIPLEAKILEVSCIEETERYKLIIRYGLTPTQKIVVGNYFTLSKETPFHLNIPEDEEFQKQYKMTFEEEPTGELLDFLNTNCTRIS